MGKRFESNADWLKRGEGRVPTKGAMAAKRASAGLGTSDDDTALSSEPYPLLTVWAKPARRRPRSGKQ
jgi:hypothetical protein